VLNFVGDSTGGTHMGDQSQQRGWYGQLTLVAPQNYCSVRKKVRVVYICMKFFEVCSLLFSFLRENSDSHLICTMMVCSDPFPSHATHFCSATGLPYIAPPTC